MSEHYYPRLRPSRLQRIIEQAPIAYLPWGAHEWHGRHNCLGVDSLKAEAIAAALVQRTGGVLFPAVYCGHSTMQRHGQTLTVEFPVELVEQLARHYFLQFRLMGFRVVVAVLGHYGHDHLCAIQRMARRAEEDYAGRLRVIAEADHAWTLPEFPGDHGGANETSYMMHFMPETVDLSELPPGADRPTLDFRGDGVGGPDPRTQASPARGRQQLELLCSRAVPQILEALKSVAPK